MDQGNNVGTQRRRRRNPSNNSRDSSTGRLRSSTELRSSITNTWPREGGRFGFMQSAADGCNDPIRCYG
ncbi:hypothetical protein MLD38_030336 [Melastoma candidum]|uniref:Uncharacterized protein n=1 Tax=Melastoma candidum TaxID=119954 RepID=A0ACB9MLB2_9MYRT|nr:hypothetical protein MLD38_030336 [Melastoma candidum]